MKRKTSYFLLLTCLLINTPAFSQPGSAEEPIRYIGQPKVAGQHYHDGQLRPAVGVKSYQSFRANRTYATAEDGSKNRYNVKYFHEFKEEFFKRR